MLLAGLEGEKVEEAKKIGLHLALALRYWSNLTLCHFPHIIIKPLRAHDERQVFTESGGLGGGAPFCLANAPVLFHLQVKLARSRLLPRLMQCFDRMTESCWNTSKVTRET